MFYSTIINFVVLFYLRKFVKTLNIKQMKEIQGKCKFVVIPITRDVKILDYGTINATVNIEDYEYLANTTSIDQIKHAVYLSEMTEEQASELVECEKKSKGRRKGKTQYGHYYLTAKESLISLLKSNDCFTKWMKEIPIDIYYIPDYGCQKYPQECYESDKREYEELPEDLLIIKIE